MKRITFDIYEACLATARLSNEDLAMTLKVFSDQEIVENQQAYSEDLAAINEAETRLSQIVLNVPEVKSPELNESEFTELQEIISLVQNNRPLTEKQISEVGHFVAVLRSAKTSWQRLVDQYQPQ